MVRLGIIGIGGYAQQHLKTVHACEARGQCSLVAAVVCWPQCVADHLPELQERGVHIVRSLEQMIDQHADAIDAVIIPTEIASHSSLTQAVFAAGWHVLVEKPPAGTIQEVDAMLAAQQTTGKLCMVGFQMLSADVNRWLKSRIVDGKLGRITAAKCRARWVRTDSYYSRNAWAGKLRNDSGWILDGTINNPLAHQIANMLFLTSDQPNQLATPTSVRAELYAGHDIEAEDTASLVVETEQGATISFAATLCPVDLAGPRIEIVGEKGSAVWEVGKGGGVMISYEDGSSEQMEAGDDVNRRMMDNFLAAIRGEAELNSSLEMCRNFTLVINGAFESAGRTRRIADDYLTRTPDGESVATIIDGIDDLVNRAAADQVTFSDLAAPWATATEPFDLTNYTQFPQRFQCDNSS